MLDDDGQLTYPGSHSFIRFRFSNEALHGILVGTLVTLLTYQAISIVFDILLGSKQRGTGKLSDISSLLLAEESALFSTFCNLFPNRKLTAWKFHGFRKTCPCPSRSQKSMPFRVLVKFLVLLVAAPLLNLGGVVLGLEGDRDITFEEAKFGGLALSVGDYAEHSLNRTCLPYVTDYGRLEFDETVFYFCVHSSQEIKPFNPPDISLSLLTLSQNYNGTRSEVLIGGFQSFTDQMYTTARLDISSGASVYRLRSIIDKEDGKLLMAETIAQLETCTVYGGMSEKEKGNGWALEQWVNCTDPKAEEIKQRTVIRTRLRLVNAEKLEVVDVSDEEDGAASLLSRNPKRDIELTLNDDGYLLGDRLIMARRRKAFLEFVPLCILTLSVVIVRAIVRALTNNDYHLGVEFAVRGGLGPEAGFRGQELISHEDIVERLIAGSSDEEEK